MKRQFILTLLIISIISGVLSGQGRPDLIYTYPKDNSLYNNPNTTIIVKFRTKSVISNFKILVEGEVSGKHDGETLALDNHTITFKSDTYFDDNEHIKVNLIIDEKHLYDFSFYTSSYSVEPDIHSVEEFVTDNNQQSYANIKDDPRVINGVSVPSDFPVWEVAIDEGSGASGKLFVSNLSSGGAYIAILKHDGTPYFYRKLKDYTRDFKLQKNGVLSRWDQTEHKKWITMDGELNPVDTIIMANGLITGSHDLLITEDNHVFIEGHSYRPFDMSTIVTGGDPDALLQDDVVQELDENGNLIWSWNTKDVYDITDAVHANLQTSLIDYTHLNSVEVDYDDNIVVSCRHQSEITKINYATGETMWRLGGEKNQFTWINEPDPFSYQHDARAVPGKPDHYTLFDNGNYRNHQVTRVVEYKIDTINMTAEKVWEYIHDPEIYVGWMGNAQILGNGNILTNYVKKGSPKACEITPAGEVVYEADYNVNTESYRTFKFNWEHIALKPYLLTEVFADKITLLFNKFGDTGLLKYIVYTNDLTDGYEFSDTTDNPYYEFYDLTEGNLYSFAVKALHEDGSLSEISNTETIKINYISLGDELIVNGDFSDGMYRWETEESYPANAIDYVNEDGVFVYNISKPGPANWYIQLIQNDITLVKDWQYSFEFDAWADDSRSLEVKVESEEHPHINYSKTSEIALRNTPKHFNFSFIMEEPTDINSRVAFKFGSDTNNVYLDNVKLTVTGWASDVEDKTQIPQKFRLNANYPNPFNPVTNLSFIVPENGEVSITVYSVSGEMLIKNKVNVTSGNNVYPLNMSNFASGVYIYSVESKGKVLSDKILLLK